MEQFERKLEAKSQFYEEPAMSYFFLMNNLCEVKSGLEIFWDDRLCIYTEQYFELYCQSSWSKAINCLKMDIGMSPWRLAPNSETYSMKDKHNLFNQKFREICEVQSMWRNNNLDRKHFVSGILKLIIGRCCW